MSPKSTLELRTEKPKHSKYPKEIKTVGDELRAVRLDRGLTQHEVAEMIGVNRNFIYEFELGKRINTIYALHKVYSFIGYLPKTLMIDENTLHGKLFAHRIRNGYTYQRVAQMIGLDKSTVRRFVRGLIINEVSRKQIDIYFEKIIR